MITDTLKKSAEPVTRFNKLLMDTVSRVGEMQMASIKDYMSMASDQARQATQIRDYEDLQKYLSNQAETFSTIMEKANDDLQEMQRMAEEFRHEARFFRAPPPAMRSRRKPLAQQRHQQKAPLTRARPSLPAPAARLPTEDERAPRFCGAHLPVP